MAKKPTEATPSKANEPVIKGTAADRSDSEEYFRSQRDSYVLPPELRLTIRDGFRFGIGFVLALLVFYALVLVGLIIFLRLGRAFDFNI